VPVVDVVGVGPDVGVVQAVGLDHADHANAAGADEVAVLDSAAVALAPPPRQPASARSRSDAHLRAGSAASSATFHRAR